MQLTILVIVVFLWGLQLYSLYYYKRKSKEKILQKIQKKKHVDLLIIQSKWGDNYSLVVSKFYDEILFFVKKMKI